MPPIPTETVQVRDLASLTAQEAERLDGRLALFRVVLHNSTEEADELVSYECAGPAEDEVHRTLWLPGDHEIADTLTVEAVLQIINHREAFTEYRLTRAVVR